MAERVGFEPTEPVRAQRFSRPPDSTTLAPLRELLILKVRLQVYQVITLRTGDPHRPKCCRKESVHTPGRASLRLALRPPGPEKFLHQPSAVVRQNAPFDFDPVIQGLGNSDAEMCFDSAESLVIGSVNQPPDARID